MDLQDNVLLTYGILVFFVLAIFATVALSSLGPPQDYDTAVQPRGYAIRRWWFLLLLIVLLLAFVVSLSFFPYTTPQAAGKATHFTVIARQYSFQDLPQTVPYDTPVVFDVTSADVNHGFAIYNPEDQLIGQVQAMPDYVNHLKMTFTERGTYIVRCLEYCGIGHDLMRGTFEVK